MTLDRVKAIADALVWPSAAAAYAAAHDFMASVEAEPLGDFRIRPVPLAGRFALQLETPRQVKPCRVLGYLGEVPKELP
jgi:hypothetical protein